MGRGIFALALISAGCVGWDDVPGASVRAVAVDSDQAAWEDAVGAAVDAWGDALAAVGCERPFVLSDEGHEVRLVPDSEWTNNPHWSGKTWPSSPLDHGRIEIRQGHSGSETYRRELLHELGHAIGLQHMTVEGGPAIMIPTTDLADLTTRDVTAAACVLGCGPCDPAADPYSGGS